MISPANAPIPAAFAVFGFDSLKTRNKIKPMNGKKNPKTPYPKPPESFSWIGCCCAPQLEHIF